MSNITYVHLTRDEAIKFIKRHRRGRQCFVRTGTFGYTQTPTGDQPGRGYDLSGLVPVGAKVAQKAVRDWVSDPYNEKGVRISIGVSNSCLFVG